MTETQHLFSDGSLIDKKEIIITNPKFSKIKTTHEKRRKRIKSIIFNIICILLIY